MYLSKVYLNLKSKEARRDLSDPYQMHSTLCRLFSPPEIKNSPGTFLWRLEPEQNSGGRPKIIIQSKKIPDWSMINLPDWFGAPPEKSLNLTEKLKIKTQGKYRYRLRANTSVRRSGKRLGLFKAEEQINWLNKQGEKRGFKPVTIYRSEEKMLTGNIRRCDPIRIFSVLFDGILIVLDTKIFLKTIMEGIGHGKTMGLGLLSIAPVE